MRSHIQKKPYLGIFFHSDKNTNETNHFQHYTDWTRYLELTPALVLAFGSVAMMKTPKGNSYGFLIDNLWFSEIGVKIHHSLMTLSVHRIAWCILAGPGNGMMLDVVYKAFRGSYVKVETKNIMKNYVRVQTRLKRP